MYFDIDTFAEMTDAKSGITAWLVIGNFTLWAKQLQPYFMTKDMYIARRSEDTKVQAQVRYRKQYIQCFLFSRIIG